MYDSRVEYLYKCLNRWTLGKYLKLLLTYHPVLLDNTFRLIIDHIQKLKLLNHTHWFGEQDLMSSVIMIVQILKYFILKSRRRYLKLGSVPFGKLLLLKGLLGLNVNYGDVKSD